MRTQGDGMAKRTVVTCDYCGTEFDAGRLGDLELTFAQGIKNLRVGSTEQMKQKKGESEADWLARQEWLRDACPGCMQKAGDALGLRLERDADGHYYFTRHKQKGSP